MKTHGYAEQGLITQGSSVKQSASAFFELVKQESALEPRAVWALWLVCFMVILFIISIMFSPYDWVEPVGGWVTLD